MNLSFDDETIQKLFGHEAAENEDFDRLKEYFFKNKVYARVIANLPLRILVGHKGIGKSALIKIAMSEDRDNGILPILIQPNDISELQSANHDLLALISEWKKGLYRIITKKILQTIEFDSEDNISKLKSFGGKLISSLLQLVPSSKIELSPANKLILDNLDKNKKITIYIDDLDRGWVSSKEDITRISALLNAIRDITAEDPNLYFRVALRSDVFFLVRTSDESTDKIESSVVWYEWTNHEILVLLIKRIETFFGREVIEDDLMQMKQDELAKYLYTIMDSHFSGRGKWENAPTHRILMSLIRQRPRDLVKLCTLAAKRAFDSKATRITTAHLQAVFETYSQDRIQDTINEYKTELPKIDRLIMEMKPSKKEIKASRGWVYSTDELLKKIEKIMEHENFNFSNKKEATAKSLITFLYKINFITARKVLENGEVDRKYFEQNRYLTGYSADFGYDWEIHPAYRWALQPDRIDRIYDELDLSRS